MCRCCAHKISDAFLCWCMHRIGLLSVDLCAIVNVATCRIDTRYATLREVTHAWRFLSRSFWYTSFFLAYTLRWLRLNITDNKISTVRVQSLVWDALTMSRSGTALRAGGSSCWCYYYSLSDEWFTRRHAIAPLSRTCIYKYTFPLRVHLM